MKLQYKHLRPIISSMGEMRKRYFKLDRVMNMVLAMEEDAAAELEVHTYLLDRTQKVYVTEINGYLELVDRAEDLQPPFTVHPKDYTKTEVPMSLELKELEAEGRISYGPTSQTVLSLLTDDRDRLLDDMARAHTAMLTLWGMRDTGGGWPMYGTLQTDVVALQLIDGDTWARKGDPLMLAGPLSQLPNVAANNKKHTGMFYRVAETQELGGVTVQADMGHPLVGMSNGNLFGEWYGLPLHRVTAELPPQMQVCWVELLERIGAN